MEQRYIFLLVLIVHYSRSFEFDMIAPMPMPVFPNLRTTTTVSSSGSSSAPPATSPPGFVGAGGFQAPGGGYLRPLPVVIRPQAPTAAPTNETTPTTPLAGANTGPPPGFQGSNFGLQRPDPVNDTDPTASTTTQEQTTHHPDYPFLVTSFMASVRVAEYGGKVEVSQTRNFHPNQTIRVDLISLTEKALNDAGDELFDSSATADLTDSRVMRVQEAERIDDALYPGSNASAKYARFTGSVHSSTSSRNRAVFIICVINIDIYIFDGLGNLEDDGGIVDTYEGLVQIELSIVDYEFCEDNSSAALTHCLEGTSHSLEFKATAEPVMPMACRNDTRGLNYMYFGAVGYVIVKQKVVVDNNVFPIEFSKLVVPHETESQVELSLRVTKFESMVTTKINIDLADSTCDQSEIGMYIPVDMERMRGLQEYNYAGSERSIVPSSQDDKPAQQFDSSSSASTVVSSFNQSVMLMALCSSLFK